MMLPNCCPLLFVLERTETEYKLKRPLSCSTCFVSRVFCEAFCRGDVEAIMYARVMEDWMKMMMEVVA